MKIIFASLTFLFLCQPAWGQLINRTLDQVNGITRQVEATSEQLRRDIGIKNSSPDLEVGRLTERLAKLPDRLPIRTPDGKTAFVEVKVEGGWRALQREWIATLDAGQLARLQALQVDILESTRFEQLELTLVRFRVPKELDSITRLQQALPGVDLQLDRNHVYSTQAVANTNEDGGDAAHSVCPEPVKVGIIDTSLKLDHPAFKAAAGSQRIVARYFLQDDLREPDNHGTAVASLLIGQGDQLQPLLPAARLYAASVFYARKDFAEGASLMSLVRALDWLLGEKVSLINMSLAGPDNRILASAVAKTLASGTAIVAAVGNEGPAAPPLFPAAYPGVIAVTAVDSKSKIYRWANRGDQVYFAAPGVNIISARSDGDYGRESGTSMAAPVVAAFLACEMHQHKRDEALALLSNKAKDLGEPGRDQVFGVGLLAPVPSP
jgi:minor extracellular protease Epr